MSTKYARLYEYLDFENHDSIELRFSRIEEIIGSKLPDSAYKYPAWWYPSDTHTWANGWRDRGWRVSTKIGKSSVIFSRINKRSFWWVSHGSSFNRELDGGYIWCPVVRDEDVQRPTWINVSKVRKGDLVVSYAKGLVRAVGVAITDCFEAPVPEGHGSWNGTGWQVDID